jgi:hypothetical protein
VSKKGGRMLRKIVAAVAGALFAGIVVGAVSRMLMMLVALAAGHATEFAWSGSASILFGYAMFMLPGALLAALSRRRGRWLLLAVGAAVLLVPAIGVASEEIGSDRHFTARNWVLVSLSSLGVFATIGALPLVTLRAVDWSLARLGVTGTIPAAAARPSGPPAPGPIGRA